ncbi:UNVERIFIED_CONTAM: hypothetical protein HHA_219678 [Hammondia hammondi]|eukprot:XP_008889438.1 hypothetical protein HHA_219678 [Hammondia hammondi]
MGRALPEQILGRQFRHCNQIRICLSRAFPAVFAYFPWPSLRSLPLHSFALFPPNRASSSRAAALCAGFPEMQVWQERLIFSSSPSRGLLLFHRAEASCRLAARVVSVYADLLRRLLSVPVDSKEGGDVETDADFKTRDPFCLSEGERARLQQLESEVPFELFGTCAAAPRLPEDLFPFFLKGNRGSETLTACTADHDASQTKHRLDFSRQVPAVHALACSSASRTSALSWSTGGSSSCPFSSQTRSGSPMIALSRSELLGQGIGQGCITRETHALSRETVSGDRELTLSDIALLPEGFFPAGRTAERHRGEDVEYSDIVVRWPKPGWSSFSSPVPPFSLSLSNSFSAFDSPTPGLQRMGDSWGMGALSEGLLLHGENTGSRLGDDGDSWLPARAGGEAFLALSSWGFHLLSSIDRNLHS